MSVRKTKPSPEIPLAIVGYDFKTASSAIREKLVTSREDRKQLLDAVRRIDSEAGLLVLETCNRQEWIVSTTMPAWVGDILSANMIHRIRQSSADRYRNLPPPKVYLGKDALGHLLRMVSGMESLAAGEAQIAGQFQAALLQSRKEGLSSTMINRLAHLAGRMAKYGYDAGIRSNIKTGVHGLTVDYLKDYFGKDLKNRMVLVAGMGKIGRKTASLLEESSSCRVIRLNRTIEAQHQSVWTSFAEMQQLSRTADALIVATGAQSPVVTADSVVPNLEKQFLILDIGIPLQVSHSLRSLDNIVYRNIDDLRHSTLEPFQLEDKKKFEKRMHSEIESFRQTCRSRDMTSFLSNLQSMRKDIVYEQIPKMFSAELQELDPKSRKTMEKTMKKLVNDYSFKLFHAFHSAMESYWRKNGHE